MFIEINDMSTGTLVTEPLNAISIDFVYKKEIDGKFCVIYVLTNGLRKVEQFDTDAEADDRLDEIKAITIGGGGGGGYVLPIASDTRLGGVKVGENLSIDANGVLSATGGSGSDTLTLDMSEVATTEVMYALINGQSPITINVTEQSHPTAFQELTDIFEDSRFGSANLNVLISNDILNNIIIPAESNLGSQFITPAISAVTTFGISTYLSIQINQSTNNLYIVSLAVDAFADKQDALVSGTNIKTINDTSILGSGNLSVFDDTKFVRTPNGNTYFTFGDAEIGNYMLYSGSTSGDITVKTDLQFRGVSGSSVTTLSGYQTAFVHYFKPYSSATTSDVIAYMYAIGMDKYGVVSNAIYTIKPLSSGYRISLTKIHDVSNQSPVGKLIKIYDQYNGTYAVNDLVIREDGGFYRCITAVTSPESFDSNKWTWAEKLDDYVRRMVSGGSSVIDIDLGPIWDDLKTSGSLRLDNTDTTGVFEALTALFVTDTTDKTINLYADIVVGQSGNKKYYTINIPANVIESAEDVAQHPDVKYYGDREVIGVYSDSVMDQTLFIRKAYLNYIHIYNDVTCGIPRNIYIRLIREPNPIGSVPETGLTYKGNLLANNGYGGTNLSAIDLGIYYGGTITQFSLVNNPGANQRLDIGNYGVYIRRGYLFILYKNPEEATTGESFAVMYGVGITGSQLIQGIVNFTKNTASTIGFGVNPTTQDIINVVNTTTSQTVGGKKTFSTLPESSPTPTTAYQLVNKKYVDDTIAAQIGTVSNQLSQI